MEKEQSPAEGATSDAGVGTTGRSERSATPRKWQRVLQALVDGKTLNRFEAARELRDWCLNTTVSQLEKRGLTILRKDETVPGHFGRVHCARYWLDPQSRARARELLGLPQTKTPAAPA